MSFLGKNINIALVGLILAVVLIAAGTTVVYQRGLTTRTQEYETTSSNLSQCLTSLTNYQGKLSEKLAELNDTSQDISKYDTLYEQKVAELNEANQELKQTDAELKQMTLLKESFKKELDQKTQTVIDRESEIDTLNARVDTLERENRNLRTDLNECLSGGT